MRNKRVLMCTLVGAVLAVMVGPWALAQQLGAVPAPSPYNPPPGATPEEIAEFCITKATQMADRGVLGNEITAERSVAIIGQLLDAGQPEDARCVARWSICWVNTRSARCIADIERLCKRCTRAIIKAGGTRELVKEVRAACNEQIKRVADSRDAAVAAIKAALPEPPAPEAAPDDGEE